jgi:spore germination cell wall hydrolase CwlJ-like protein
MMKNIISKSFLKQYAVKVLFGSLVLVSVASCVDTVVQKNTQHYNLVSYSLDGVTLKERERQIACLAQNIYFEAGSEPFEGKVAVAQVTLNRVASGKFPSDICQVVYQKNVVIDRVVCQFSWYCEQPARKHYVNQPRFNESEAVAKKVLLEGFRLDGLKDAMFYHADYVAPGWKLEKIGQIGRHIFYRERNANI